VGSLALDVVVEGLVDVAMLPSFAETWDWILAPSLTGWPSQRRVFDLGRPVSFGSDLHLLLHVRLAECLCLELVQKRKE
jgi:hypothetical protein